MGEHHPTPIHVFTTSRKDRAITRLELNRDRRPAAFLSPDAYSPMDAASIARRLEVWVGCLPVELMNYRFPEDLLGRVFTVGPRSVLCTKVKGPTWLDDLAVIAMFDQIPTDQWNDPICPRCRCDGTVQMNGVWWCARHGVGVWEGVEYREGVAWREPALPY